MTRLSVGLLSLASYLWRGALSARIVVRETTDVAPLGLGDVETRLNQPRHLSSNWAVLSLLPPFRHDFSSFLRCRRHSFSPSVFSLFSLFFLWLSSSVDPFFRFFLCSAAFFPPTAIHLRRVLPATLFPRPTPFQRTAANTACVFFVFVLSSLLPSTFRLFSRGFSFSSTRFLPPVNHYTVALPSSTPRLVYGNVATCSVVVTTDVSPRSAFLVRVSTLLWRSIWKNIYSRGERWLWEKARTCVYVVLFLLVPFLLGNCRVICGRWFVKEVFANLLVLRELYTLNMNCSRIIWHQSELLCYSFRQRCFRWYTLRSKIIFQI